MITEAVYRCKHCHRRITEGGYDTGYRAMIRTEDITMIQVKKVIE